MVTVKQRSKAIRRKNTTSVDFNTLTPDEQTDFASLEQRFQRGQRDSTAALKEIRERKLYREQYSTFDEYMSQRWNRTRQWATQQIGWLRRQELLEQLAGKEFGKSPYQLTVADAQILAPLEPEAETLLGKESDAETEEPLLSQLFVEAVLEAQAEANAAGKKRTVEMIQRAVRKRTAFLENRDVFGDDLTLEESEQLARLEGHTDATAATLLESARRRAKTDRCSSDASLKESVDQLLAETQEQESKPQVAKLRWVGGEDDNFTADNDSNQSEIEDTLEPTLDQSDAASQDQFDIEFTGDLVELAGHDHIRSNECEAVDMLKRLVCWFEDGSFFDGGLRISLARTVSTKP